MLLLNMQFKLFKFVLESTPMISTDTDYCRFF